MKKFWNLLRAWKRAPEGEEVKSKSYTDSIISYLYEMDNKFIHDNYVSSCDSSGWKAMCKNADKNIEILQSIFRYVALKTYVEIRIQDINYKYRYDDIKKMLLEIVEGVQ